MERGKRPTPKINGHCDVFAFDSYSYLRSLEAMHMFLLSILASRYNLLDEVQCYLSIWLRRIKEKKKPRTWKMMLFQWEISLSCWVLQIVFFETKWNLYFWYHFGNCHLMGKAFCKLEKEFESNVLPLQMPIGGKFLIKAQIYSCTILMYWFVICIKYVQYNKMLYIASFIDSSSNCFRTPHFFII